MTCDVSPVAMFCTELQYLEQGKQGLVQYWQLCIEHVQFVHTLYTMYSAMGEAIVAKYDSNHKVDTCKHRL